MASERLHETCSVQWSCLSQYQQNKSNSMGFFTMIECLHPSQCKQRCNVGIQLISSPLALHIDIKSLTKTDSKGLLIDVCFNIDNTVWWAVKRFNSFAWYFDAVSGWEKSFMSSLLLPDILTQYLAGNSPLFPLLFCLIFLRSIWLGIVLYVLTSFAWYFDTVSGRE